MTIEVGAAAGGEFVPRFSSGAQNIVTSSSGTLVLLTPPAGQKVRLNALMSATTTVQSGITVKVGTVEVIDSKGLADFFAGTTNNFMIGEFTNTSTASGARGIIPPLVGKVDEAIEVIKDSGSTTSAIGYSYQFGE